MRLQPLELKLNCPRMYETATGYWEGSGTPDHCAGCGGKKWEHVAEVNAMLAEIEMYSELKIPNPHQQA